MGDSVLFVRDSALFKEQRGTQRDTNLVLVDPAPKGAIGDTDLTGDPGDRMLLIGSSNQPDSFSAKFRRVGWVCSWQCSPFRALFSVLNSPRNRCKSTRHY